MLPVFPFMLLMNVYTQSNTDTLRHNMLIYLTDFIHRILLCSVYQMQQILLVILVISSIFKILTPISVFTKLPNIFYHLKAVCHVSDWPQQVKQRRANRLDFLRS